MYENVQNKQVSYCVKTSPISTAPLKQSWSSGRSDSMVSGVAFAMLRIDLGSCGNTWIGTRSITGFMASMSKQADLRHRQRF